MNSIIRMLYVAVFCASAGIFSAGAQNRDTFEEFRKSIKADFSDFRKKVLDDYDKYLDGIWTEYQAFRGIERNPMPKPKRPPVVDPEDDSPAVSLPDPAEPTPPARPLPEQQSRPRPHVDRPPEEPARQSVDFDYYGISIKVPETGLEQTSTQLRNRDFAELWRLYSNLGLTGSVIPALYRTAAACHFNDWFLFDMVRCYVENVFRPADARMRISLEHFLLNNLGYDVRIGTENTGQPILLVAFEQLVYARTFAEIDGQRYYLFYDGRDNDSDKAEAFKTCDLPREADKGMPLDLVMHGAPAVPYTPHHYAFRYEGLEISGEVNAALMPMLYRYPQMPIGCYAQSMIDAAVRKNVVAQIRGQLAELPQTQAVNKLLQFIQHAFDYATDDEQHGFEKPYFFEEMLFYPQCDCEDRSIFYSYLLWNALDVENQLIGYPGHEAVAVHLDAPISGDGYMYGDKKFYVSDPTYIGAVTGMCMPDFRSVKPEIDCYGY